MRNFIKRIIILFVFMCNYFFAVKAKSNMSKILEHSNISQTCKSTVNRLSKNLIGPKKYKIIQNTTSNKRFFEAFLLLKYNDQETHINITAYDNDSCEVNYNETFTINIPCTEARESLFSRWKFLGRLSEETFVMRYDFPRDKKILPHKELDRTTAYLTETNQGESCLVTKKQHNIKYTRD